MWARAEQIVPNAGDGFGAGKDMCEPCEDPRDDEHQQFHLGETLENLPELFVTSEEQLQYQLTDGPSNHADVLGEEISEIGLSGSLHHVVSGVLSK